MFDSNTMTLIYPSRIFLEGSELLSFSYDGELGYRTLWIMDRLENQKPFSEEYIVGQISGDPAIWTNFPRVHGDIAGRWILAETVFHSGKQKAPEKLSKMISHVLDLQDEDGSFGYIHKADQNLNMHKMYGNAWLLRALVQYAFTFGDNRSTQAAIRLGDFYSSELPLWLDFDLGEGETGFYAISRSCYFHATDGLVALYRLTGEKKYLDLVGSFIPHLTPYETSGHSHMFLTIQRGLIEYYLEVGDSSAIQAITQCLDEIYEKEVLENGSIPERFHLTGGESSVDEACSVFDWFFCCIRLYEVLGETCWLDRAILTLQNAIFFNQTYNGGFGSTPIGPHLVPNCKEAPWCCSLYGGWALSRIGVHLISEKDGRLTINYPQGGTWNFKDVSVVVSMDEKQGRIAIRCIAGVLKSLRLYVPRWMRVNETSDAFVEMPFVDNAVEVSFSYLPWLSRVGASPKPVQWEPGLEAELFYGPYLMAHRGKDSKLITNIEGTVTWLKGFPYYSESFRYTVPSKVTYSIYDVFLGVREEDDQLYLYPIKEKESPDGITTHVLLEEEW